MSKIKILLFGPILNEDSEKVFQTKLKALNGSKAGPFDIAFVVGRSKLSCSSLDEDLPIPVYFHDSNNSNNDSSSNDSHNDDNIHILKTGIQPISIKGKPDLIVASLPWNWRIDDKQATATTKILEHLQHASYTGCDLLLSHEWPQGIEDCLSNESKKDRTMATSFDVAHVALQARARYHVAPSTTNTTTSSTTTSDSPGNFQQSVAFDHLAAITHTHTTRHVGRFLVMPPVNAPNKSNRTKFVHAVGIVPLHSLSTAELQQQRPPVVHPCPYTDASYETQSSKNTKTSTTYNSTNNKTTAGLSEASVRRLMHEERHRDVAPQQHRWATKKRSRPDDPNHSQQQHQQDAQLIDPTCKTLFLHGLHQDVSGRLQIAESGDPLLQAFFRNYGLENIRRPALSSSFCFLEFPTHAQAAKCWEEVGHPTVAGIHLTLKWGNTNGNNNNANNNTHGDKRQKRMTESEAQDSSTIYFKLPPEISDIPAAGESLRKWMEQVLEKALAGDNEDEGTDKVTAEMEPALRVQLRQPEGMSYGFLDFASHAAASMALATLTGSTDGGKLLVESKPPLAELEGSLYLHWGRPEKKKDLIEDSSGFRFERQHFPADSRKDCWFCLASEDCAKHLITGVYNLCYSAMPKGPVHPGHVLLIPVHHSGRGALVDSAVAEEVESIKDQLRKHAALEYDMDLFVFERAIETKHGLHTHVQCVPVAPGLGIKIHATMLGQAKNAGMQLRELGSDLNLTAVVSDDNDDTGGGGGYFYAEVPELNGKYKRFLYKHDRDGGVRVPLQFGREVLAAVMGKPQLAHWKSCVLDHEQEAEVATKLRDSLQKMNESS